MIATIICLLTCCMLPFAAKQLLYGGEASNHMDSVGSDSLLGLFKLMMSIMSLPRGGDPLMILNNLQRRRDALNALDLSSRIKDMAARLYTNYEEQCHEVARLKVIQVMSQG